MTVNEYREKHPNCEYCHHRIFGFDRCRATDKWMSKTTAKHCPCYVPEPWKYNTDKKGGTDEAPHMASLQYIGKGYRFCPDWISVKERLPDIGCYLIASQLGDRTLVGMSMFVNGKFDADFVTHWMPLPMPPKTEGEING